MRYLLSSFLILFFCVSCYSQEIVNLTGSWINLRMDMEWNDRIDLDLTQSNRFDNLVGAFAVSNTTLKISYKLTDWLKATAGYRYSYRVARNRKFNRYQLALQAGTKLKDVKLSWRTRFEYKQAINVDNPQSRLRNKATASYKIKSLDIEPKVFVEYWYVFDEPLRNFSKYRVGVSLSKSLSNKIDLKVGFNYDSDINQDELERESIALMGLTYNFKRSKATK